jgi:hypothetical protein
MLSKQQTTEKVCLRSWVLDENLASRLVKNLCSIRIRCKVLTAVNNRTVIPEILVSWLIRLFGGTRRILLTEVE